MNKLTTDAPNCHMCTLCDTVRPVRGTRCAKCDKPACEAHRHYLRASKRKYLCNMCWAPHIYAPKTDADDEQPAAAHKRAHPEDALSRACKKAKPPPSSSSDDDDDDDDDPGYSDISSGDDDDSDEDKFRIV